MEIKELKDCELKKVSVMYDVFKEHHPNYNGDSLDFINEFLSRCECCGSIEFDSDLRECAHQMVCEDCSGYLFDEEGYESNVYEPDPYDEYIDRLLEEGEM